MIWNDKLILQKHFHVFCIDYSTKLSHFWTLSMILKQNFVKKISSSFFSRCLYSVLKYIYSIIFQLSLVKIYFKSVSTGGMFNIKWKLCKTFEKHLSKFRIFKPHRGCDVSRTKDRDNNLLILIMVLYTLSKVKIYLTLFRFQSFWIYWI